MICDHKQRGGALATTTLLVEILVIGSLAEVWLTALFLAFAGPISFNLTTAESEMLKALVPVLAIPVLSLTYSVGWATNFLAERIFKSWFEDSLRNILFKEGAPETDYEVARIIYLQTGSPELGREFVLDRHILRISRANALNFLMIGVSLIICSPFLGSRRVELLAVLCAAIAAASFWQWRSRYVSYYKRLSRAAKLISAPSHAA
jgi:hypothetical protein